MALSFRSYFEGGIERLVKNEILPPLKFSDLEQCIECIKGKFLKQIKKGDNRSAGILEIIHTNIWGPFSVRCVDGFDSFITFIDDYSHFGYIYPIKERLEALDKFKIFKAEIENRHDKRIKIVRSNRGGGVSTTVGIPHMDKFLDLLQGFYRKME